MSAHRHSNRQKPVRQVLRTLLFTTAFCGFSAVSALAGAPGEEAVDDRFKVKKDYTETLDFDQVVSSIVIGNPGIADISLRNDMSVFVHGRSPGETNMLVYNEDGDLVKEYVILVSAAQGYLTLSRGSTGRTHYSCAGRCERVVRMDDDNGNADSQFRNFGYASELAKGKSPSAAPPSADAGNGSQNGGSGSSDNGGGSSE